MKKTYGYARVSTREQHLDRQLKALMDAGVEERDIITDKVSGKDLEREGYQSLKNHFLRDGDIPGFPKRRKFCRPALHNLWTSYEERHNVYRP